MDELRTKVAALGPFPACGAHAESWDTLMRAVSQEINMHELNVRHGKSFAKALKKAGKLISVWQETFPCETLIWNGRFGQSKSSSKTGSETKYIIKNSFIHEVRGTASLKRVQSDSKLLEKPVSEWQICDENKIAKKKACLPQPLKSR